MSKHNYRLTEADYKAAYEMYQGNHSLSQVGEKFGVADTSIGAAFKRRGWVTRARGTTSVRHALNHNAFSILNAETAYWIGFLMADGCVFESKNGAEAISLVLSGIDVDHVQKFKDFLGSGHKITTLKNSGNGSAGINVFSRQIAKDLATYGVTPRKSRTATVIGLGENRDFWRGALDGDGTIGIYGGKPTIGFCGSKQLVTQFTQFAKEVTGCNISCRPTKSAVFVTSVSGKNAVELAKVLYIDSSISLDRKRNAAKNIAARAHVMVPIASEIESKSVHAALQKQASRL